MRKPNFSKVSDFSSSLNLEPENVKSKLKKATSKNRWINYFAVLIAVYFSWNTVVAIKHNDKLETKLSSLKKKAELLEESNKNLELQKSYYSSEEYQKKSLKENFNLVDEGENMLIVKDLPAPKHPQGNVFSDVQDMYKLINQ